MSDGKNNAFLSDDKNAGSSSLEPLLVVTGMIKNSSQRITKQLSSINTGRCELFLIECAVFPVFAECPGLKGCVLREFT